MTTGTKALAILVILANVVAAFFYDAWWMLAVAAGLVAVFAQQLRRGEST